MRFLLLYFVVDKLLLCESKKGRNLICATAWVNMKRSCKCRTKQKTSQSCGLKNPQIRKLPQNHRLLVGEYALTFTNKSENITKWLVVLSMCCCNSKKLIMWDYQAGLNGITFSNFIDLFKDNHLVLRISSTDKAAITGVWPQELVEVEGTTRLTKGPWTGLVSFLFLHLSHFPFFFFFCLCLYVYMFL